MLKVATVFSGIGSFEYALKRLDIPHRILFACDNGEIPVNYDLSYERKIIAGIKSNKERAKYIKEIYQRNSRKRNFVETSYLANYGSLLDNFFYDIYLLDAKPYRDKVDILVGGSPCQSFSLAGKRKGLKDPRGQLVFEFIRIVRESQPKVFIFENVKAILNQDQGETWKMIQNEFDTLGYQISYQILNAKDYGIPQNRNRLFIVGLKNSEKSFSFPEPEDLRLKMQDLLENNFDSKSKLSSMGFRFIDEEHLLNSENLFENKSIPNNPEVVFLNKRNHGSFVLKKPTSIEDRYYLSNKVKKYVLSSGTKSYNARPSVDQTIAHSILSTSHKMHRSGVDNYITEDSRIRRLTPIECLRLMGFDDRFIIKVSDTQIYKQAGNSIVVDVFISLLNNLEIVTERK